MKGLVHSSPKYGDAVESLRHLCPISGSPAGLCGAVRQGCVNLCESAKQAHAKWLLNGATAQGAVKAALWISPFDMM